MNQGIFKIVYNAARGEHVVTNEHATSNGAGSTASGEGMASRMAQDASSLWFAARATAFGMQRLMTSADTLPITAAPIQGSTTTLGTSSNSTQVVNIATPNLNGVSNNFFSQYNVGAKGVILNNNNNNSAQATQTQIGGTVQGNPAINQGAANLIMLQVTSGAPSQLLGQTKVAGGRGANVVLANPAGISCGGCGFINRAAASR